MDLSARLTLENWREVVRQAIEDLPPEVQASVGWDTDQGGTGMNVNVAIGPLDGQPPAGGSQEADVLSHHLVVRPTFRGLAEEYPEIPEQLPPPGDPRWDLPALAVIFPVQDDDTVTPILFFGLTPCGDLWRLIQDEVCPLAR
jgi:hypothetical protein